MTENLWPEDLAAGIEMGSALVLLREQADALAMRTNGRLRTEARATASDTVPLSSGQAALFLLRG